MFLSQYLRSRYELRATKVLRVFEHQKEVDVTDKNTEQLIPASVRRY